MADEPKTKPPEQAATNVSPAPTEVAGEKPADKGPATTTAAEKPQGPPADALSDGTVPTVLTPGTSHKSVPKGKTSLQTIYRRADIMTTLLTFVGAVVAAGIIVVIYIFVSNGNKPKPAVTAGKVTTLSSSDLSKLGSFFEGNSAGTPSEVLTVNSSSLFKGRVAVDSDLKVTGGVSADGTTTLGNLQVNQNAQLGVANVVGSLTVNGPLTLQSPATFTNGATVKGNLTTSGNGSFGGSLSAGVITVGTLSVSGTLNLNGHLSIGGRQPAASPVSGTSSSATVQGNDSAGTIVVGVPAASGTTDGATLANVTFSTPYNAVPVVIITPIGRSAALLEPFITATATGFQIGVANFPSSASSTSYAFNFWVVQY